MKDVLRIGSGAGYSGDRIDPAVELAKKANLDYLVFECLAERTIALAQLAKLGDPNAGFDPLFEDRMRAVLPVVARTGTRVLTNMGAANPLAAAKLARRLALELGLGGMRIAVVTGDDVLEPISSSEGIVLETGEPLSNYRDRMISANAYLGVSEILPALETDANLIITGRVADPSLFLGPIVREFGWPAEDYGLLGQGTVVGHLLECAGHLTGGYYADPVTKPVPGLARLGFPYAQVAASGEATITKLPDAGGRITLDCCKEQLLYELGNPRKYLTPDVTADFTGVHFEMVGEDSVRVTGGSGAARPSTLKVAVGFRDGFLGEGQISYAGPHAIQRSRLAAEIVAERLKEVHGIEPAEVRADHVGEAAAFRGITKPRQEPEDVRLRFVAKTGTRREAEIVAWEVESLLTNGPAGGGGARKHVAEIVGVVSTLVRRDRISPDVEIFEV